MEQNDHWRFAVDALRHYRHNWMNEIQILAGYAQLQKYDELKDFLGSLLQQAEREKVMLQISDPELSLFLLLDLNVFTSLNVELRGSLPTDTMAAVPVPVPVPASSLSPALSKKRVVCDVLERLNRHVSAMQLGKLTVELVIIETEDFFAMECFLQQTEHVHRLLAGIVADHLRENEFGKLIDWQVTQSTLVARCAIDYEWSG